MFRIGFYPLLEAEQRHKELIKEVENYRLAKEALAETQSGYRVSFNFLALIGKGISSLGGRLEKRYGGNAQSELELNRQVSPDGCG